MPLPFRRVTAVAVLTGVALSMGAQAASAAAPKSVPNPTQWVGLIAPSSAQLTALSGSAVRRVVIGTGWNVIETGNGQFDRSAIAQLQQSVATAADKGLDVVLDLGLQYTPSWVFNLNGPTRFVNQYGDVWKGSLSQDVPNSVFDPAVRAAEAQYLQTLGSALAGYPVAAIRVGGLLSGELRYPDASFDGHTNSLWDYDSLAQQGSPVPGWKPGSGTAAQAHAGLTYYYNSLTNYLVTLMTTVQNAFPRVDQEVMFPSWGLRPGMTDDAINAGLQGTTVAEVNGMISSGLDWDGQVRAIAATGFKATVYSTWVDAPSQGSTPQQIPPIAYLAGLAQTYGLPVAGENTGGGGADALNAMLARMRIYHLAGVMYMAGPWIDYGLAGITLPYLINQAQAALAS